jgi:hypothetical protein
MVRTKEDHPASDEFHGKKFRIAIHAVHRHSWRIFQLRAIQGKRNKAYHLNHYMSHIWNMEDNRRHGLAGLAS